MSPAPFRARLYRALKLPLCCLLVTGLGCGAISVAGPAPAQAAPLSALEDARSAATLAEAAAIAREHDHPVTDLSSLTETTTVEALPDGTQQFTSSTEPVRVKRDDRWVDVTTDLVKSSNGMLAPAASPVAVEFSAGGSGPLARVQTTSGAWMTIASPLGALPDAVVEESSVTYPEVLPGVDLRLTATITGMTEVLVVKTPEAADNPRLAAVRFGISGARVADGAASESATAVAPDGTQLVSPSPMWWDSAEGGDADGPGGAGLALPVPAEATSNTITVDASLPADAADVTYPAYVDPDFTGGTQAWTFVDSRYPNSSYWLGSNHGADNQAHVGHISSAYTTDGAHTDRTFWELNTAGLNGKHILGASFNTQEIYSSACTHNVYNLWISGSIGPGTTWNTQPGFVQHVSQATLGPQRSNCAVQYGVGFDALGVANWASQHGNIAMTVGMSAANEADWTSWRKFTSAASLTVRYNSLPYNPWSPRNAGSACSTTSPGPTFRNSDVNALPLSVNSGDPDAGNVEVHFYVQTPAGANVVSPRVTGFRAPGTFQVNVPTHLADGAYRWTARTYDGIDWSPGNSSICYFQIRNVAPSAPVVTASIPTTDTLTVGQPLDVTLSQAVAADGVVGFAYTWRPSADAPTYGTLPGCTNDSQTGGMHYVCGSSVPIQVAPPEAPQSKLTVWAFGSASSRSEPTTLTWSTVAAELPSVAHQWATDVGAAECPSGTTTVSCLADNAPDPDQLQGQYPIAIPPGVTFGDSADPALAGALTFDTTSTTPMMSQPGVVVDTTKSFTVGAWLTPSVGANGLHQTAVSARGQTNSGFFLQLNPQGQWAFTMMATDRATGAAPMQAAAPYTAAIGQTVYVAGVWDAVNHEMRLYVNGSLAINQGYWPVTSPTADRGLTLGSAWYRGAVVDRWNGRIANPVVVQAALTSTQIFQLQTGGFFPGID